MADFRIKRGDDEPTFRVTLGFEDGVTEPDLAGSAARLIIKDATAEDTDVAVFNVPATSWDVETREMTYVWADGDTVAIGAGDFNGEVEVTLSSGRTITFPNDGYIELEVVADLG